MANPTGADFSIGAVKLLSTSVELGAGNFSLMLRALLADLLVRTMNAAHYSERTQQVPTLPPLPPEENPAPHSWHYDGYTVHHNPDIPHISNLLMREADAWRAVLALHSATVHSAQQLARAPENCADALLQFSDERSMNSESREASYCSALTGLASQCDCLISEVLKLRTYRKVRKSVEDACVREIVRSHADEILAVGQTLSSNGSLNVASVTAELRAAIQTQRNQVSQLRALLEVVNAVQTLPLGKDSKIVIGVSAREGEARTCDLDKFMSKVFQKSRELNEKSLCDALSSLFGDCDEKTQSAKQFARRVGDRATSHPANPE